MTQEKNFDQSIFLHELAIECLRIKQEFLLRNDPLGAAFFGETYASIINDLYAETQIKQPVMSEEERNTIIDQLFSIDLSTEMWVAKEGFQLFTPENE